MGLITDPDQAEEILASGAADLVLIGREMLREPYWAIHAGHAPDREPDWPLQYGYAVRAPKQEASRGGARGRASQGRTRKTTS